MEYIIAAVYVFIQAIAFNVVIPLHALFNMFNWKDTAYYEMFYKKTFCKTGWTYQAGM